MRIRKGRWAIVEQEELFRLYDNGVPLEEIAEGLNKSFKLGTRSIQGCINKLEKHGRFKEE